MRPWLENPAAAYALLPFRIRKRIRRLSPRATACWVWVGALHYGGEAGEGYGRITWEGKNRLAHHVTTEIVYGEKRPPDLVYDHVFERCCHTACVRPDHGFWRTNEENGFLAILNKRAKHERMRAKARLTPQDLEPPF